MNKFNTTEKSAQNDLEFRVETLEQLRLGQQSTLDYITITQAVNLDSLELQQASNTTNIGNKVSKTDHTPNKVFISSPSGVLTTSTGVFTADLQKLLNITISNPINLDTISTDTAASKVKTDLISITQNVDLDNIESQQTIIVGNLGTISQNQVTLFGKFNLISVTQNVDLDALETKLNYISVSQAVDLDQIESDVATNNAKNGITGTERTKLSWISVSQNVDLDQMETDITANNAKTGITTTEIIKLSNISVSQAVNLDAMETDIANNISNLTQRRIEILANEANIATNTSNIATNTSNISTNTYKLTGVGYTGFASAGTYTIEAGDHGGLYSLFPNGSINIVAGFDNYNSSGEIILKQNNTERLKITNGDTSIGSGNNKLIVDSAYVDLSTPGMEFNSSAFFLLKKPSATSHWNLIMDRGDDYWSGFRSTHHWDTYYSSWKYNQNASGTTMYLNYYSHGNINLCGQGGFVGIGGNPSYPLHILASGSSASTHAHYGIYQSPGSYMDSGAFNRIGIGATNGYYTNTYIAMKVDYGIWTSTLTTSSDRRIKTNIRDVPDELSLKQLRELPCVYYDYIDYQKKGDSSTIGFIAQDVKKVMPMAVSLKKEFIPNEMRNLIEPVWETITDEKGNEKFKLTINDLDVSGNTSEAVVKPTKYRFYVNNGDNEKNLEIENLENEPKSFIFEEKWKNIFLYGKEVDDFHIIEKDKIFAMLFSATQQIDKNQIILQEKVASLEAENITLKEQLSNILSRLDASGI